MNNVHDMRSPSQQSEDEASVWIAKLDRGLSSAETKALSLWMDQSESNETTLLAMAELWDNMGALSRLAEVFPHASLQPAQPSPRRPAFGFGLASVIYATIALVAVASLLTVGYLGNSRFETSDLVDARVYETAVGGLSTFELTDGSRITLNTNSRIEVDFRLSSRAIRLDYGEIHIDVAHDPDRPLVITAGQRMIQAIGTAFTVKLLDPNQVELLVAEGKVEVGIVSAPQLERIQLRSAQELPRPTGILYVEEGERLLMSASGEELERLEDAEIADQLSWREGNLVFTGESLADAVAEISRYTSVNFVFVDDELRHVRVAGLYKAGDVNGFLASVRSNFDIHYERIDGKTILLSASGGSS